MPKLPMTPADRSEPNPPLGAGSGLTKENADGLRALERINQRIEQETRSVSVWSDATREFRQSTQDLASVEPGFSENFRRSTERRTLQAVSAAPAGIRAGMRRDLSAMRAALEDRVVVAEGTARAVRRRVQLQNLLGKFAQIVRDDPTQLEAVVIRATALFDDMNLPRDRRAELHGHVRDLIGNAALDGLLEDPTDAQALLSSGDFDGLLTPESKAARVAEVDDLVQRDQLLARERLAISLSDQADAGGLTEEAIEAVSRLGMLSAVEADLLRVKNEEARAAAERERAKVQRVAATTERLDPTSPEDQEAVDAYWKVFGEQIAQGDPDARFAAEMSFVKRRGVLPAAMRNKYAGLLHSSDPALQVAGAAALKMLAEFDPRLVEAFSPELTARARAMNAFSEQSLEPERVVALAEDALARLGPETPTESIQGDTEEPLLGEGASEEFGESEESGDFALPEAPEEGGEETPAARRGIRTSSDFIAFFDTLSSLSGEALDERVRESGFAPDLIRIALSLVGADAASEAGQAEILDRARQGIDALPAKRGIPKQQLRRLVDGLAPVLGDRDKTLQAIAANREAFRDRFAQNRDFGRQFQKRLPTFEQHTNYTARPVPELTRGEGGLDPSDPRADVAEELPVESGAERPTKLPRIAFFRKGSDTPFMTLPSSLAMAVMSESQHAQSRLDFLDKWLTRRLKGKELEDTFLRAMISTLGTLDFEFAKDAFRIAHVQLANGQSQEAILATIIPTLFPDTLKDSRVLNELFLDLLPVIGEIRSAKDAIKDIKELERAIRAGNTSNTIKFTILSTLDIAGAAPLIGALFRPIKVLSARALRTRIGENFLRKTPGIKRVHGMITFPRTRKGVDDLVDRTPPEEMFRQAWRHLDPDEISLVTGIWRYVGGKGVEVELIQRMRNMGVTIIDEFPNLRVNTSLGDRIFDAIAIDEIGNFFNLFSFPIKFLRNKARGIEIKRGKTPGSRPQRRKNAEINRKIQEGEEVTTSGNAEHPAISIGAIKFLRGNLRDVSDENWEKLIRRLFKNNVDGPNSTTLREENLERLVNAGTNWLRGVKNTTDDGPITVGKGIIVLAIAARATGLFISELDDPLFALDSFSGPMPLGS